MSNHKKVIPFPESAPHRWIFCDYFENGVDRIEEWYQQLSLEGQETFTTLLKNTRKIENHLQWGGKFKFLKGDEPKKERIWQLDFIAEKRQYRLLGVFQPGKRVVLLSGCYHKGDVYTPKNWLDSACKRAKKLREKGADAYERQIREDI